MNCAKYAIKKYIPYEHVVRNLKFLNVQQLLKYILSMLGGANSTFVG